MKTLYISDLDGTLLNSRAELSKYTINALNRLIDGGMLFSVATARTAATVVKILADVHISAPIILMNGVFVFDRQNNQYVKTETISETAKEHMLSAIRKHNLSGFLYAIKDNQLSTYYENTDSPNVKAFIEERTRKYAKVFTRVENFSEHQTENLVYFSVSDVRENLETAYAELLSIHDLHTEFYRDVYNEDYWFMEICTSSASKYNAVSFLREQYGYERVIGFGDNLNDLPLFSACDECYAVANAKPEIKAKATTVIASNRDNSVAKWLEQHADVAGCFSILKRHDNR